MDYTFFVSKSSVSSEHEEAYFENALRNHEKTPQKIYTEIFPKMKNFENKVFIVSERNKKYVFQFIYYCIFPKFFRYIDDDNGNFFGGRICKFCYTKKQMQKIRKTVFSAFSKATLYLIFLRVVEKPIIKLAFLREIIQNHKVPQRNLCLDGVFVFFSQSDPYDIFSFCDLIAIPRKKHTRYTKEFHDGIRKIIRKL